MTKEELEQQGYIPKNRTVSMIKANLFSLLALPVAAVLFVCYAMQWQETKLSFSGLLFLAAGILAGIVIHEFLHGFTWHFFCEDGWKSIRFGIGELATPYCHCREALTLNHYRLGLLVPCLLTAVVPYGIAYLAGCHWLMLLSLLMLVAAGGDLTIFALLLTERSDAFVLDHPSLCGCTVYQKPCVK